MNILDEDIGRDQRRYLESRKIHVRQIGIELGRSGMKDRNEVVPLLHQLKRPTFFTLDHGFYHPALRHPGYCLVFLDVWNDEAAQYVQRFLRHRNLRTQTLRMGKVMRVRPRGVSYWLVGSEREMTVSW